VRALDDFFGAIDFRDQRVLDLGPGQYDLGELLRQRGARTVGIDNDPAVLELGRHKGFEVVAGNLKELDPALFGAPFDGMFCKLSLNAFWFIDAPERLAAQVAAIVALLRTDGWAWIAPWNGIPTGLDHDDPRVATILQHQAAAFVGAGFRAWEVDPERSKYYGIHGVTANHVLFTRGLDFTTPGGLRELPASAVAAHE